MGGLDNQGRYDGDNIGGEMYTEEEAKGKWCPFVRLTTNECEPAHNTYYGSNGFTVRADKNFTCIASGCMAWRWGVIEGMTQNIQSIKGYCGLAGK